LVVVVVTMVAMMASGGKSRAGKDENKQNSSENLLHGPNVTRRLLWKRTAEPGEERAEPERRTSTRGVN
jgi:hypothetical protein